MLSRHFKEAGDVFDPELSASLRKNIYEKGSTEEAMDLYVNFRGRKPIIEPLLKVRGLDGFIGLVTIYLWVLEANTLFRIVFYKFYCKLS